VVKNSMTKGRAKLRLIFKFQNSLTSNQIRSKVIKEVERGYWKNINLTMMRRRCSN